VRARDLTVAEAARLLEISEARVRRLLVGVQPVGRGERGASLYSRADIDTIARQHELGRAGRLVRSVIVHENLTDETLALEAAGLHVLVMRDIMDGLAQHDGEGLPIMVLPTQLEPTELNLLRTLWHGMYVLHVGDDLEVSFQHQCIRIGSFELRSLVQAAWRLVGERRDQVRLKI
jgi:hypothetical protein